MRIELVHSVSISFVFMVWIVFVRSMYFDGVFNVLSLHLYCFCLHDENLFAVCKCCYCTMYSEQYFTPPPLFQILCCTTVRRERITCVLSCHWCSSEQKGI